MVITRFVFEWFAGINCIILRSHILRWRVAVNINLRPYYASKSFNHKRVVPLIFAAVTFTDCKLYFTITFGHVTISLLVRCSLTKYVSNDGHEVTTEDEDGCERQQGYPDVSYTLRWRSWVVRADQTPCVWG